MSKAQEFIALYALDIRENPEAYKRALLVDPETAAAEIIDGLDESDIAQLLRDLKAERRLIAKHKGE